MNNHIETTILNNATTHLTDLVNGTHPVQNGLRKALKKMALHR